MNKIKRGCVYLLLIAATATVASCKKNSTKPDVEVEPEKPVVIEDTNYINVAATVEVSPLLEGAKFVWKNEAKKGVVLKFKYNEDGINKEVTVENNADVNGTVTIPIFGLTNFTVTVANTGSKVVSTRLMGILPQLKPESKLSKTGWSASASSEINDPDEELNGAENIVDDVAVKSVTSPSSPSFWQSDYYLDPIFPYPHWLVVDMKKAIKLTKIGLNAHTDGNQGFTEFKIEGSIDGIAFTDIGEGQKTFNPKTTAEQTFKVIPATAIRYVKITLLLGTPYPCLANFEAYARQ
ncbi:discoidin domain-containing protein [Pedobacter frigoris]|uniref:discoidin domain-containing protein n=1 Tax=Pedobacter frigoris TaxID=2571272 RepID=UPI00293175EC|nr:discoidin domain-containing protein [Pedobacter frigoris]